MLFGISSLKEIVIPLRKTIKEDMICLFFLMVKPLCVDVEGFVCFNCICLYLDDKFRTDCLSMFFVLHSEKPSY